MKCVQLSNGTIVRVANETAAELVRTKQGNYTNKDAYKRQQRKLDK